MMNQESNIDFRDLNNKKLDEFIISRMHKIKYEKEIIIKQEKFYLDISIILNSIIELYNYLKLSLNYFKFIKKKEKTRIYTGF